MYPQTIQKCRNWTVGKIIITGRKIEMYKKDYSSWLETLPIVYTDVCLIH